MNELIVVMQQFGEDIIWMMESPECLERQKQKAVKMQKQINEIISNFPSNSRAAEMESPGQWGNIHSSSKKPSYSYHTLSSQLAIII